MAEPARPPTRASDKGLPTLVSELWQLVLAYLQQETLEPFKNIGRFIAYGIIGASAMAIGFTILGVGLLRIFQVETGVHLTGSLTWVPYLLTLFAMLGVAGLAGSRIGAAKRNKDGR